VSTIALVEQRYCAANPALTSLQLKLKLRYRNVGKQKLILYRGHDLFYQTRIRSVPGDTASKPYEIVYTNSRYFDEELEPIEQPTPGEVFVILPPGGVYERELMVGVGVAGRDAAAATSNHTVREGRHTLELIVSTWYKSRPLAERLRQRWERKGLLWVDPIASLPIPLTVEKPDAPAPCQQAHTNPNSPQYSSRLTEA
jgi:hypothetical protein